MNATQGHGVGVQFRRGVCRCASGACGHIFVVGDFEERGTDL